MQKAEAWFYITDVREADGDVNSDPIFLFSADLEFSKEHTFFTMSLCNTEAVLFKSGKSTAHPFLVLKNTNTLGTH